MDSPSYEYSERWHLVSLQPTVWKENRALGTISEPIAIFRRDGAPITPETFVDLYGLSDIIAHQLKRFFDVENCPFAVNAITEMIANLARHGYPEACHDIPCALFSVEFRIRIAEACSVFEIDLVDIGSPLTRDFILEKMAYAIGDGVNDAHGRGFLLIAQRFEIELHPPCDVTSPMGISHMIKRMVYRFLEVIAEEPVIHEIVDV